MKRILAGLFVAAAALHCASGSPEPQPTALDRLRAALADPAKREEALDARESLEILADARARDPSVDGLLRQTAARQWSQLPAARSATDWHVLRERANDLARAAGFRDPLALFEWLHELDAQALGREAGTFLERSESLYLAGLDAVTGADAPNAEALSRWLTGPPSASAPSGALAREVLEGFRPSLRPSVIRIEIGGDSDALTSEPTQEGDAIWVLRFAPRGFTHDASAFFGLVGRALLRQRVPGAPQATERAAFALFASIPRQEAYLSTHTGVTPDALPGAVAAHRMRALAARRLDAAFARFELEWMRGRGREAQRVLAAHVDPAMHAPLRESRRLGESLMAFGAYRRALWQRQALERRFGDRWWAHDGAPAWLLERWREPHTVRDERDSEMRWLAEVAKTLINS